MVLPRQRWFLTIVYLLDHLPGVWQPWPVGPRRLEARSRADINRSKSQTLVAMPTPRRGHGLLEAWPRRAVAMAPGEHYFLPALAEMNGKVLTLSATQALRVFKMA